MIWRYTGILRGMEDRTVKTAVSLPRRLRGAAVEVRNYNQYDYVLINRDLDECAKDLEAIVRTERLRRVRMEDAVRPILESFEAGK